jgi:hypothetical protein
MSRLPIDSTARLWIDYIDSSTLATEHTVQFRYSGSDRNAVNEQAYVLTLLNAITAASFVAGWRAIRARSALGNEQFSQPIALSAGLAAFVGTNAGAYTGSNRPRQISFQGRAPTSPRRVAISLFGITPNYATPANWRWATGGTSPAWVAVAVAALNNASCPFVTIDALKPVWYSYVNIAMNGYWERRSRLS